MTFEGVLLAKPFPSDLDPTGWWLSPKLDGVRAYWDGERLLSRTGKVFHAPPSYLMRLPPNVHLDGELLYAGPLTKDEHRFSMTVSIVRRKKPSRSDWERVQFRVFDAPSILGPFEERLLEVCKRFGNNTILRPVIHEQCKGLPHLIAYHQQATADGYEGTMLRKHRSKYERKRSSTLLKLKDIKNTEGVVFEHVPGEGKHAGRMGALRCRLRDKPEVIFKVGTGFSDEERDDAETRFPPGTVVTVQFQEWMPSGAPRFPRFVVVRDYE